MTDPSIIEVFGITASTSYAFSLRGAPYVVMSYQSKEEINASIAVSKEQMNAAIAVVKHDISQTVKEVLQWMPESMPRKFLEANDSA